MRSALLMAITAVAVLAAGWVYGWLAIQSRVPGWSGAVYALLLAAVAGGVPMALAVPLRVRSRGALRGVGLVAAVAILYLSWGSFGAAIEDWVTGGRGPGTVAFWSDPLRTWAVPLRLDERGWYEMAGLRPSGVLLWTFWGFEALLVCAAGVGLPPRLVAARGHCAACNRWLEEQKPLRIPADEGDVARRVRDGGLAVIGSVVAPSLGASKWIRVDLRRCPACSRSEFALGQEITARVAGGRGTATAVRSLRGWAALDGPTAGELERIQKLLKAADKERFDAFAAARSGDGPS